MSASSDTDGAAPLTDWVQVSAGARPVLATHSTGKLAELRQILTPPVSGLVSESVISAASPQASEPVEDGLSFVNSALLRARTLARVMGLPMVVGDSGLCVNALGGAPGIFSTCWSGRYGGDTTDLRLPLDQLDDVVDPHHGARFIYTTVLVQPASGGQAEQVTTVERSMKGHLVHAPRGEGSFDYDPIFVPVQEDESGGRGRITAQMAPEEKRAISHRGQIFCALAPVLIEILAG